MSPERYTMPTITVRVDEETRERIAEAAEARGVTTSNYVRQALEDHFRVEEGETLEERPSGAEPLNLTSVERQMLVLLHRSILSAQGDLNESYYDAESEVRSIQALEGGFAGEYGLREFAGISEPMTQTECELVWDILDMFRVVQSSVEKLGTDGWAQLGIKSANYYGTFQGFDLNDSLESRLLMYARYLVKTGRWEEQADAFSSQNDRGNSHMPMLSSYRAMLRVFKPLWKQAIRGGTFRRHLSADEIEQVLIAGSTKRADS